MSDVHRLGTVRVASTPPEEHSLPIMENTMPIQNPYKKQRTVSSASARGHGRTTAQTKQEVAPLINVFGRHKVTHQGDTSALKYFNQFIAQKGGADSIEDIFQDINAMKDDRAKEDEIDHILIQFAHCFKGRVAQISNPAKYLVSGTKLEYLGKVKDFFRTK